MTKTDINARELLSDSKFYESYARWDDKKYRYETWEEAVSRVMEMHRSYYKDKVTPELEDAISFAENEYKQKNMLGAQRALQYGGEQLIKHQMRMYNCTSSYADRPEFFGEVFYILLTGAGAGFSVQTHHVDKLPLILPRTKVTLTHTIEDSIEGWADAAQALIWSYFGDGEAPTKFAKYQGRAIRFDPSLVRPKGAEISGGFKAPGPEPLMRTLARIETLIEARIKAAGGATKLRTIDVYDIVMHEADAVLAGGVRRSATICLFSSDDEDMLKSKTGNWFNENPQRGRSNNSAVILRDKVTYSEFVNIMDNVRQFGEPGFIFTDSTEWAYNPCVEIGMFPSYEGQSGWQGCNLVEINGAKCVDEETFYRICRAAAIMGTLQAGYTDFKYVSEITKAIFEREALLGVSITGWMNSPDVLLNEETLRKGARIVKETNKEISKLLGINPSARSTCVKPAGNASVILMTASGVHGEHSKRYFRVAQMNKETEVAKLIKETNPHMVEEGVWSAANSDYAIYYPVVAPEGSVFRQELSDVALLSKVKLIQSSWVEEGTDIELSVEKGLRHNVSNTITVPDGKWGEVTDYLYENRKFFAGVSFLAESGDKDYNQAPNTEVKSELELVSEYGPAAFMASGLIVDASKVFPNLWEATRVAQEYPYPQLEDDGKEYWVDRFRKFANNHFDGDMTKTEYCLKDVHLLHKWETVKRTYVPVDFVSELTKKQFTDIDTMGAAACYNGACELPEGFGKFDDDTAAAIGTT